MNLDQLKAALAPLTKFGQDESSFEVEGIPVTIRPLLPREEIAAQQHAVAVLAETQTEEGLEEGDPMTRSAALRYFDQYRIEIIAYAIVQVQGIDLRLPEIETGAVTDSGAKVRLPKHVALRKIIEESWSRGMITIVWSKYGDLMAKIAVKADKVTEESLAELDSEIDRQQHRLEDLKEERERRAKGDPGVTALQITALVDAGKAMEREIQQAVDQVDREHRAAQKIRAAAKVEAPGAEPAEEPPMAAPPRKPVTPRSSPPPGGPAPFISSFADPDEEGGSLADEARIELAQQAHLRARQQAVPEEVEDPMSRASSAGEREGKEAFRMPPTTLSKRGVTEGPKGSAKLDPAPGAGAENPNFPKRR